MKQFGLLCLLLAVICVQSSSITRAQATSRLQAPPPVVHRLELNGPGGQHVTIWPADLQSMPRKTLEVHNAHTGAMETYQGVELSLLLARLNAPLEQKLRGKALAMYVVAEGADKYRALYSLAEVDPAFHNGTVIVADREGGQPITRDGPFKLVNTEDKRPARGSATLRPFS
jgi:hypothetical protein